MSEYLLDGQVLAAVGVASADRSLQVGVQTVSDVSGPALADGYGTRARHAGLQLVAHVVQSRGDGVAEVADQLVTGDGDGGLGDSEVHVVAVVQRSSGESRVILNDVERDGAP